MRDTCRVSLYFDFDFLIAMAFLLFLYEIVICSKVVLRTDYLIITAHFNLGNDRRFAFLLATLTILANLLTTIYGLIALHDLL